MQYAITKVLVIFVLFDTIFVIIKLVVIELKTYYNCFVHKIEVCSSTRVTCSLWNPLLSFARFALLECVMPWTSMRAQTCCRHTWGSLQDMGMIMDPQLFSKLNKCQLWINTTYHLTRSPVSFFALHTTIIFYSCAQSIYLQ